MNFLLVLLPFVSVVLGEQSGTNTGNNVNTNQPGVPPDVNAYLNSIREIHNTFLNNRPDNSISYAITTSNFYSQAQAQASLTNSLQQFHQNALASFAASIPQGGTGGGTGGTGGAGGAGFGFGQGENAQAFGGSYGGQLPNQGGAIAGAAIGPNGVQQSAQLFPENPNNPNVNANRFGTSGGTYSVFTSSQSSSSNINGKPSHFHKATTTVNDNGKVTTYTVHDP